jgi:DNA invertase Pin-like site-specific DNA recombinase
MQQALIYLRVSTGRQADEGWSLDAQEKFCRKYADNSGYKVAGVFREEGKSGTNTDRPALKDMLEKCQKDKNIKAILVQETDRLARNTEDHMAIRAILRKADIKLISVAQPMLDSSPEGTMMDTILSGINQFYSDLNSRKTKKGMVERFNSGWWPGLAKLGYLNEVVNGEKIITKDPTRWHLVQEALKMYLRGNHSAQEVSDVICSKGLTSRTGKKIWHSIMTNILRDPFYAGIMKWGEHEKIGNHESMISIDEHRRILHIMADHNNHASRRRIYDFLLRGFVFCDICGRRYVGEKRKKINIDYYHCSAPARIHSNEGQNIKASALEEAIANKFKEIQFTQSFIDLIISKVKSFYKSKTSDIDKRKLALSNRKMGIEKQRGVAETKLIAGTLSDEAFVRINSKITVDISNVQKQIEELDKKRRVDVETIRTVLLLTNNIYGAYQQASPRVKRMYLSLFWEGFWTKDRQIIRSKPTQLIEALLKDKNVFVKKEADKSIPTSRKTPKLRPDAENLSVASVGSHANHDVRIRTDWLAWRDAFRNYDWEKAFPSPEATISQVKQLLALVY